jgi:hypothetical protein
MNDKMTREDWGVMLRAALLGILWGTAPLIPVWMYIGWLMYFK